MSNYINEAFKALEGLNEDTFSTDSDSLKALDTFLKDNSVEPDEITVYDMEAEVPEDIEGSYEGKVILDCNVCRSKLYKDKADIKIDKETNLANIEMECPYCYSHEGFKIIGEVAPFAECLDPNKSVEESLHEAVDLSKKENTIAGVLSKHMDELSKYTDANSMRHAIIDIIDKSDIADKPAVAKLKRDLFSKKSTAALLSTIGTYMTGTKVIKSKRTVKESFKYNYDLKVTEPFKWDSEDQDVMIDALSDLNAYADSDVRNGEGTVYYYDAETDDELYSQDVQDEFADMERLWKEAISAGKTYKELRKDIKDYYFELLDPDYNSSYDFKNESKRTVKEDFDFEEEKPYLISKEQAETLIKEFERSLRRELKIRPNRSHIYRYFTLTINLWLIERDDDKYLFHLYIRDNYPNRSDNVIFKGDIVDNSKFSDIIDTIKKVTKEDDEDMAYIWRDRFGYLDDDEDEFHESFRNKENHLKEDLGSDIDESIDPMIIKANEFLESVKKRYDIDLMWSKQTNNGKGYLLRFSLPKDVNPDVFAELRAEAKAIDNSIRVGIKKPEDAPAYYRENTGGWMDFTFPLNSYGIIESINENIGTDIDEYQKWVDYDMKRYGRVSGKTNRLIKKAGLQLVKDKYGDYEVIAGKYDESLNEDVTITTDDSKTTMTSEDDGKVTVTTEPAECSTSDKAEVIKPVKETTKLEIESNDEDEDVDIEEFDEESFDDIEESFLKEHYSNVKSYATSKVTFNKDSILVEGVITFDNNIKKKTSMKLVSESRDKNKKYKMICENLNTKQSFNLIGDVKDNKFITESLKTR